MNIRRLIQIEEGALAQHDAKLQSNLRYLFIIIVALAGLAVAVVNAFAEEFTRRGNQLVSGSLDSSVEFVGEELAERIVGAAIERGSVDFDFQRVAQPAGDFVRVSIVSIHAAFRYRLCCVIGQIADVMVFVG